MTTPKTEFKDMICVHNVASTGSYGKTMRSIVFIDKYMNSYIWITTAGLEFTEGKHYNFTANCNERNILSYVKLSKPTAGSAKSEQPDHTPVDIFDLIFDTTDTHLTNN